MKNGIGGRSLPAIALIAGLSALTATAYAAAAGGEGDAYGYGNANSDPYIVATAEPTMHCFDRTHNCQEHVVSWAGATSPGAGKQTADASGQSGAEARQIKSQPV